MLGSPTIDPNPPSPADLGLTKRQVDVLALLMQGKSNKAIGRALVLAPPTVKSHVGAILRALDVTSRTQAVLKVAALGWNLRGDESSRRPEEGLATASAMPTALAANGDAATGPQARPPGLAVPESASIVVLPFANMSGDPSQDYFADGMVEEITIALGRIPRLFVIASSSAFTYKGRAIGPQQIGAELGVRYILGGSVRKQSRQVRITVQLCDAIHGGQIWGDRFEGGLSGVFELQDSVAASVSATIVPALRSAEIEQARRKPIANLSAYDLYLRALPPQRDTFAQNEESLRLLYRAIELEPSFGAAYGLAAFCHLMALVFDFRRANRGGGPPCAPGRRQGTGRCRGAVDGRAHVGGARRRGAARTVPDRQIARAQSQLGAGLVGERPDLCSSR
jgi:TolB-like protein/DNA-binding CsgD family transcriptional regulator